MAMRRKRFPTTVETEVLTKCRRRCALCFGLNSDTTIKTGQLAHIDRNPENPAPENAAFLCTHHHAEYDTRSRQTKGFAPNELRTYQHILYEYLASPGAGLEASGSTRHRMNQKDGKVGVSLDVYDRRLPVYRTATEFVRTVLRDLRPELQEILQFVADTEEALFLFDERIAAYLEQVFKKALRLHTIGAMLNEAAFDSALANEQTQLALWFTRQFEEIRTRFAPFLRLAKTPR